MEGRGWYSGSESKRQGQGLTTWSYRKTDTDAWIPLKQEDSDYIEDEYQTHLKGKRGGLRVLHCFGDGFSSFMDYEKMMSACGSFKCQARHKERGLDDSHLVFNVKRELKSDLQKNKEHEEVHAKINDRLDSLSSKTTTLAESTQELKTTVQQLVDAVAELKMQVSDLKTKSQ